MGLHVLGGNGEIIGTNLAIATSGRIAAGAEADNGGSIQLRGGSISTSSDVSFGLIATNGANVTAQGITVNTAGANAYGAFARTNGTVNLESGTVIDTSGRGSYGLLAMSGGNIVGNGISITTTGRPDLFAEHSRRSRGFNRYFRSGNDYPPKFGYHCQRSLIMAQVSR
jgi:autotransporter family porin